MHTLNEFDFLTQETVRMSEHLSDSDFEREFFLNPKAEDLSLDAQSAKDLPFENLDQNIVDIVTDDEETATYPDKPGLVYCVHKSGSTFSLRGYVTDSIENSFDCLTVGDKPSLRALRVDEDELDRIDFFEFQSREQAEIVRDQLFNKRYPLEEDILCNISDPGFSWWYGRTDAGFRINFKSHKLTGAGERMRLGPIGDVVIAHVRLHRLKEHFKKHIPVSEIAINEKHFILKSSDKTHPMLNELMKLFETGEISDDSALLCELETSLCLYLQELGAVRRIWLKIEQSLTKNADFLN